MLVFAGHFVVTLLVVTAMNSSAVINIQCLERREPARSGPWPSALDDITSKLPLSIAKLPRLFLVTVEVGHTEVLFHRPCLADSFTNRSHVR